MRQSLHTTSYEKRLVQQSPAPMQSTTTNLRQISKSPAPVNVIDNWSSNKTTIQQVNTTSLPINVISRSIEKKEVADQLGSNKWTLKDSGIKTGSITRRINISRERVDSLPRRAESPYEKPVTIIRRVDVSGLSNDSVKRLEPRRISTSQRRDERIEYMGEVSRQETGRRESVVRGQPSTKVTTTFVTNQTSGNKSGLNESQVKVISSNSRDHGWNKVTRTVVEQRDSRHQVLPTTVKRTSNKVTKKYSLGGDMKRSEIVSNTGYTTSWNVRRI